MQQPIASMKFHDKFLSLVKGQLRTGSHALSEYQDDYKTEPRPPTTCPPPLIKETNIYLHGRKLKSLKYYVSSFHKNEVACRR